jgi:hypothetical protein
VFVNIEISSIFVPVSAFGLSEIKKRKENDMGALIMFGFVSLIAIVGGIYFYLEDKKDIRTH